MKKMILLVTITLAGICTVNAQKSGGFQRPSVEDRVKMAMEKLAAFL